MQIANAQLNAEVRALKAAGAGNPAQTGSAASSTISTATASVTAVTTRAYRNHGKRFAALSELWVKGSTLRRPYPERFRSLGPWHPQRWVNNAAWEEGIVAELYHILPESCHSLIEELALFSKEVCDQLFPSVSPDLTVSKFLKGAKDFRGSLIDNVRKRATDIFSINSVTAECYSTGYDRSQIPAITDLLKSPKKPDEQYALYPRVLFTNYEVVDAELFGSSALLKVSQFYPIDFGRR